MNTKAGRALAKSRPIVTLVCEECGDNFEAQGKAKTCSEACRQARSRRRRAERQGGEKPADNWPRCEVCLTKYKPKPNKKTCSDECANVKRRRVANERAMAKEAK